MYTKLLQIQGATTEEEFQIIMNTPHILNAVMSCGYTKFIGSTMLSDREEIVKLLCVREVVLRPKSAIDEFVEGLDTFLTCMYNAISALL